MDWILTCSQRQKMQVLQLPNGEKEEHTRMWKRRSYPDGTVIAIIQPRLKLFRAQKTFHFTRWRFCMRMEDKRRDTQEEGWGWKTARATLFRIQPPVTEIGSHSIKNGLENHYNYHALLHINSYQFLQPSMWCPFIQPQYPNTSVFLVHC